jgi:hypothetical protein
VPPITAAGREVHHFHHLVGHRLGHERADAHAAALGARGDLVGRPARTIARGDASSSSIGTASAPATLTSTASDGLPSPDSRLAMVERGTAAAFASRPA